MNEIFIGQVKLRAPFALKRIPFVARFHRVASKQRSSRKAQLAITAPLEKLFRLYYRMRRPESGELVYAGPEGPRTINFNARNLAFDILYADLFRDNYEDETAVLLDA